MVPVSARTGRAINKSMGRNLPEKNPDSERLRLAAEGDAAAWGALFATHHERLRRIVAFRIDARLRGRIDPSDVIQETFIEAARGMADFVERGEMTFFVWLRWLAAMKLNALHRHHLGFKARDATREVSLDRGAMPAATTAALAARLLGRITSASEAAIREERKARLHAAIDALDPIDREMLVLRHFEELTNAEAAQTLGIQEPAASKRYIRAIRRLKDALGAMPGGTWEFRL